MEVSGQLQDPAVLPPRKEPSVPIWYDAGCDPGPVWTRWRREKFLATAGNRTTVVQYMAFSIYWIL